MYVCLCFGVTEKQVHDQIEAGACSPRQIASACKAGTDCGGCVQRIQAMLGRPAVCSRRTVTRVRPVAGAPGEGGVPVIPGVPAAPGVPAVCGGPPSPPGDQSDRKSVV